MGCGASHLAPPSEQKNVTLRTLTSEPAEQTSEFNTTETCVVVPVSTGTHVQRHSSSSDRNLVTVVAVDDAAPTNPKNSTTIHAPHMSFIPGVGASEETSPLPLGPIHTGGYVKMCAVCNLIAHSFLCDQCDFVICEDCIFDGGDAKDHDPAHTMRRSAPLMLLEDALGESSGFNDSDGLGATTSFFHEPCMSCQGVIMDNDVVFRCQDCKTFVICVPCHAVRAYDHPPSHQLVEFKLEIKDVKEGRANQKGRDNDGNKFINEYTIVRELGRGSFAKVKLIQHISTKCMYAMKVMKKKTQRGSSLRPKKGNALAVPSPSSTNVPQSLLREVVVMKIIDHPNVVKLVEIIDDADADKLYLIMEFCNLGPLHTLGCPPVPLDRLQKYASEILLALTALHELNLFHRDIKPANCLLSSGSAKTSADVSISNTTCKLADFGECSVRYAEGADGTPAYMCPELMRGEKPSGEVVDSWAFAVTLHQAATGDLPFAVSNHGELRSIIASLDEIVLKKTGSVELDDLLGKMLSKHPQRLLLSGAAAHIYFHHPEARPQLPDSSMSKSQMSFVSFGRSMLTGDAASCLQMIDSLVNKEISHIKRGSNVHKSFFGRSGVKQLKKKSIMMQLSVSRNDNDDSAEDFVAALTAMNESTNKHKVLSPLVADHKGFEFEVTTFLNSNAVPHVVPSSSIRPDQMEMTLLSGLVSPHFLLQHSVGFPSALDTSAGSVAAGQKEKPPPSIAVSNNSAELQTLSPPLSTDNEPVADYGEPKLDLNHTSTDDNATSLTFQQTSLLALPDSLQERAPTLVTLTVTKCRLRTVGDVLRFSSFPLLTSVSLAFNLLKQFPTSLLEAPQLCRIDVSHNYITHIPEDVTRCRTLEAILADSNYIAELSTHVLSAPQLKHLSVSDNPVTSLPKNLSNVNDLCLTLDDAPQLLHLWEQLVQQRLSGGVCVVWNDVYPKQLQLAAPSRSVMSAGSLFSSAHLIEMFQPRWFVASRPLAEYSVQQMLLLGISTIFLPEDALQDVESKRGKAPLLDPAAQRLFMTITVAEAPHALSCLISQLSTLWDLREAAARSARSPSSDGRAQQLRDGVLFFMHYSVKDKERRRALGQVRLLTSALVEVVCTKCRLSYDDAAECIANASVGIYS